MGSPALHERLHAMDPAAAANIHPNNLRRIIRALEVCIVTGTSFSELQRKQPPAYTVVQIGLTMARDALYIRADRRFDEMMAMGFLDEVRTLLDAGYSRTLPSMSSLGYTELAAHLLEGEDLAEAVQRAKYNTHQFIRRQLTWFRGHDQGVKWYDVETLAHNEVIAQVQQQLEDAQRSA
jgi:tRNA dimethylallyltransferase